MKSRHLPWVVFAILLLQALPFGLTDDEAYYWVLAQHPAWGYAFHPPMVAWLIALSQVWVGWLGGAASVLVVRLPAAACAALSLALAQRWLGRVSGREPGGGASLVLVSLAGLFGLAWMMVPDSSLMVGLSLAILATTDLCERSRAGETVRSSTYLALAGATMLTLLSKYSGVLVAGSTGLALWVEARGRARVRGAGAVITGAVLAALPILYWNAHHEWASILYQVRERHGDLDVSWKRYLRFWLIELVIAGPGIFAFFWMLPREARRARPLRYLLYFIVPAALVFLLQPLWGDFKPHWALVVWWPVAFGLAHCVENPRWRRLGKLQRGYGLSLIALVLVSCHAPVLTWALRATGKDDPRLDVTNDLQGWRELRAFLDQRLPDARAWPVLGSRYQTASQAAFALAGRSAGVSLVPRDLKARDEWPELHATDTDGPDWPRLLRPVLFVTDNRYDAPPEYKEATCTEAARLEARRGGIVAKWIGVWRCVPRSGQP